METLIIKDIAALAPAAEALQEGGLVAVPTETVYGLCCSGLNPEAVAALYEAKGRPETKPLALMVPGPEAMELYCRDIPEAARYLAERCWPGPLTIILPARDCVPEIVRAGGSTVGLRCPRHPLTLALLRRCGLPLAGPSANPSGCPSPRTAEEVLGYFDGRIPALLDGGPCAVGLESTLLDMSRRPYRILRQGSLPREDIEALLRQRMTVIGISGSSGSGKSSALRLLEERGALVLDCDILYHRLLRESGELREALVGRFGPGILREGEIDRQALGRIVFSDEEALRELNRISHGFVRAEAERQLTAHAMAGGSLAAIDAVALFESGLDRLCRFTVGILAEEELRVRRIMARDGISEEAARLRTAAQKPRSYFEAKCDFLLENSGSLSEFQQQCQRLFRQISV